MSTQIDNHCMLPLQACSELHVIYHCYLMSRVNSRASCRILPSLRFSTKFLKNLTSSRPSSHKISLSLVWRTSLLPAIPRLLPRIIPLFPLSSQLVFSKESMRSADSHTTSKCMLWFACSTSLCAGISYSGNLSRVKTYVNFVVSG